MIDRLIGYFHLCIDRINNYFIMVWCDPFKKREYRWVTKYHGHILVKCVNIKMCLSALLSTYLPLYTYPVCALMFNRWSLHYGGSSVRDLNISIHQMSVMSSTIYLTAFHSPYWSKELLLRCKSTFRKLMTNNYHECNTFYYFYTKTQQMRLPQDQHSGGTRV